MFISRSISPDFVHALPYIRHLIVSALLTVLSPYKIDTVDFFFTNGGHGWRYRRRDSLSLPARYYLCTVSLPCLNRFFSLCERFRGSSFDSLSDIQTTSTLRLKYLCGRIGGKIGKRKRRRDAKRAKTSGVDVKRARTKRPQGACTAT